jgi:hypothetical protein
VIYVERDSQKKIVLGHKGETIKAIGQAARKEIAGILEQKVHLFLFVKVRENWGNDPERYREMGLDFSALTQCPRHGMARRRHHHRNAQGTARTSVIPR